MGLFISIRGQLIHSYLSLFSKHEEVVTERLLAPLSAGYFSAHTTDPEPLFRRTYYNFKTNENFNVDINNVNNVNKVTKLEKLQSKFHSIDYEYWDWDDYFMDRPFMWYNFDDGKCFIK